MSPPPVHWRFTPATTRPLRLLVYAAVGLLVGPVLGFVALVLETLVSRGGVGVAVVALVLALIVGLGVGSGRVLFALGTTQTHADTRALSRRWLVGSVLAGAVLAVTALDTVGDGVWLFVGCLVAGFVALVAGAALRSKGSVVPAENRVDYGGRTVSLDAIRSVHSVRVERFVFALVRYHPGRVGPSTPRLLVVSADALNAVESARASHDTPGEEERASTAVRAVAGAVGLACLVAGPLLWLLLPTGGRVVAAYLGGFGFLFGAVFLRYAAVA